MEWQSWGIAKRISQPQGGLWQKGLRSAPKMDAGLSVQDREKGVERLDLEKTVDNLTWILLANDRESHVQVEIEKAIWFVWVSAIPETLSILTMWVGQFKIDY